MTRVQKDKSERPTECLGDERGPSCMERDLDDGEEGVRGRVTCEPEKFGGRSQEGITTGVTRSHQVHRVRLYTIFSDREGVGTSCNFFRERQCGQNPDLGRGLSFYPVTVRSPYVRTIPFVLFR